MKVRDIMSSTVRSAELMDSIGHAAREMADHDIGMLPVLDGANLVGVVTDRDIAVRAVAGGIAADAPVRRIMSSMSRSAHLMMTSRQSSRPWEWSSSGGCPSATSSMR
jgi:CBS-domain-containing membrane protein